MQNSKYSNQNIHLLCEMDPYANLTDENSDETLETLETIDYPLVSDRYKAVFVDAIVIIVLWIAFAYLFELIPNVSANVRMAAYIFSVYLYEPIFVSLFGGSIGHLTGDMKVVREKNRSKKLPIYLAIPRFAIKVLLGFVSLFTVTKANKGRAVHDMAVGSIILFKTKN